MSASSYSPSVTGTVYSVIWPETRALIRKVMVNEIDQLMERHERAYEKRQDAMHQSFADAWQQFAAPQLQVDWSSFPEFYPCSGSSEAIREVLGRARAQNQDLIIFDGDYEGYEALASPAKTRIHRVSRANWRQVLAQWKSTGAPWARHGAQWWISQPSALDGCVWPEFAEWIASLEDLGGAEVWVDLAYVGCVPKLTVPLDSPIIQGVAFSLSKVFGVYYRRIGGLFSRHPVPGLWGNRWFKSLDALYLGEQLLHQAGDATAHAQRIAGHSAVGQEDFQRQFGAVWATLGIQWQPSDVPMLIHARTDSPTLGLPPDHPLLAEWRLSRRGHECIAARRLCLTPLIERAMARAPSVA